MVVCRKIGLLYTTRSVLRPSVRFSSVPNHFPPILFLEGPFQDCPRTEERMDEAVVEGGLRGRMFLHFEPVSCVCTTGEIVCEPARGFTYGVADPVCAKCWPRNYAHSRHLFRIRALTPLDLSGVAVSNARLASINLLVPRCVCGISRNFVSI